jgi:hypothetical protein
MAEDIVKKPQVVATFYHIMKQAGKKAASIMKHLASTHEMIYELLPIELRGTHRRLPEKGNMRTPYFSSEYALEYDPEDIYIYGGCALALYDGALHGFKKKYQLNTLEKRVLKNTTDIDLAWFPRVPDEITGWVATSESPMIVAMVKEYKRYLQMIVTRHQENLKMLIRKVLEGKHEITEIDDVTIHHHHGEHEKKAGVHSIKIACKINGAELQLCEISIHDSASSQQYDESHYEIPHMLRMTEDPVYCPPKELVHLDVYRIKIPVPNIELYSKQQLFTFVNKLKDGQYQKALASFRRVLFVLYLLEQLSHPQNANEKTKVKKQIGVNNIDRTIEEIHEMINSVKHVVRGELRAMCSGKHQDETMMILCSPMKPLKGPFSYSMYPRSKAADMRFASHQASYSHLSVLIKRMEDFMKRIARSNQSMNMSNLLEEANWVENRIVDEIERPSENHRNLHQKIGELTMEVDGLYAKYDALMKKPTINSGRKLDASAVPFTPRSFSSLPPLAPKSHTNSSRRRTARQSMYQSPNKNTRKNANKN